ncbi:hypothetical protein [Bordetella sp. H567]|uniref:hypothetical protein n=1 Tax=Bordetella sp. H567 TaxID=1697043 RepID=UPI0011AB8C9A|nr:hypothetical protein [Bordetella sp. H567]
MATPIQSPNAATPVRSPDVGDAMPVFGSESAVLRAMAEAERLLGEIPLKQNAHDMKEALLRREAGLQKKRNFVFEACEREQSAASWRFATKMASGVLSMFAGGVTLGGAAGAGRQMNKAVADGSVSNMTTYTPRGNSIDTWNKVGQSGQFLQQGVGGMVTAIGDDQGTKFDIEKRYKDVLGQMSDSDVQLASDIQRRRNGDVADTTKRVEKMADTRVEYLRAAVRTLA